MSDSDNNSDKPADPIAPVAKGTDRRRSSRRIPKRKISVFVYRASSEVSGFIYDISSTGMAIFSSHRFPAGDEIAVFVRTSEFSETFHCRVIWAATIPSLNRIISLSKHVWRIGLEFTPRTPQEAELAKKLNEAL